MSEQPTPPTKAKPRLLARLLRVVLVVILLGVAVCIVFPDVGFMALGTLSYLVGKNRCVVICDVRSPLPDSEWEVRLLVTGSSSAKGDAAEWEFITVVSRGKPFEAGKPPPRTTPPEIAFKIAFPGSVLRKPFRHGGPAPSRDLCDPKSYRDVYAIHVSPQRDLLAVEMEGLDAQAGQRVWGLVDFRGLGFDLRELTDPRKCLDYRHGDKAQLLRQVAIAAKVRYREVPVQPSWDTYVAAIGPPEKILFQFEWQYHGAPPDPRFLQSLYAGKVKLGDCTSLDVRRRRLEPASAGGKKRKLAEVVGTSLLAKAAGPLSAKGDDPVLVISGVSELSSVICSDPGAILFIAPDTASTRSVYTAGPVLIAAGARFRTIVALGPVVCAGQANGNIVAPAGQLYHVEPY